MITISPFSALRPAAQHAKDVASRPYDVLNTKEAKEEAQGNPHSFLHITKAEIDLPEGTDLHSEEVYRKAKENLDAFIARGILFRESKPCYYIYRLVMNGRAQTGLVCGSSVDDYENGLIKKHEFTRPEKEKDRIDHMLMTGAQTGNVFLAYRNVEEIDDLIAARTADKAPQYDFTADDGIQHSVWVVNDDESIEAITQLFKENVPASYIADGHHRAASAAKVRAALGADAKGSADIFLTTLFPDESLAILDYNRLIKDLNGYSADKFLSRLKENFDIQEESAAFKPTAPGSFGLLLGKKWYSAKAKDALKKTDPIGVLDVSLMQEHILTPLLNIRDQRTDKRIDFVGGIRGLQELEKRVNGGEAELAISLYPVSMSQLFAVADSGEVMPPKSTWFEPKLRDGLLTHLLD